MVPSSSYGKLLAYFLMCVLLCFGLAGLLPLIFLVFGIVMTSYSRQVTHLVTASKLIAGFYGILAGIMGLIAMWHVAALRFAWMQVYPREDHFGLSILFAVLCGIGVVIILATRFLVRRAFEPYADVIAAQGFWGASRSTVRTVSQTY